MMNILQLCGDVETNPGPDSEYKMISMCHINIQSMGRGAQGITSAANVKLDQMTILSNEHKSDIISVGETWLTEEVANEEGYTIYRKDRATRGGGVCAYIHNYIPCKSRPELEQQDMELMWIELWLNPKPMMIAVAYRPPGMNRPQAQKCVDNLQDSVKKALDRQPGSLYRLGDFND